MTTSKRIWLAVLGEPLPTDGDGNERFLRTVQLCQMLSARGHQVSLFTSSLNHETKQQRVQQTETVRTDGFECHVLYGRRYERNVSIARIFHHRDVAGEFAALAQNLKRPDVIVSCYPTAEVSGAMARYARKVDCPILIDIRDFWPDIFALPAPPVMRPLARALLSPLFRQSAKVMASASALTGITDAAVQWGLERARRPKSRFDRAFHLAYQDKAPLESDVAQARQFWDRLGVREDQSITRMCFLGKFSRRLDLKTVIEAARLAQQTGSKIQIVLCGTGETVVDLRALAQGFNNVVFPGWIDQPKIWSLMRRSQYGLLPYPGTFDFALSYPNKVGEYLSAGLPIISSTRGAVEALLLSRSCGYTYDQGNVQQLAQLLARCAKEKPGYDTQSTKARATFEDLFNHDRVYGAYCDFLEELSDIGTYALPD